MSKKTKTKKTGLEKLDTGNLTIEDYKRARKLQEKLIEIFHKKK